jgi:hypothetical protein
MMDIVSLVLDILCTVVIFGLSYFAISLRMKGLQLAKLLIQSELDKKMLSIEFQKAVAKNNEADLQNSNGFIKFISESRDSAYEYIESVQESLINFDNEIAPILKYAETFGTVNGDNTHTEMIKKIALAYENLKKVLPEQNETPNN